MSLPQKIITIIVGTIFTIIIVALLFEILDAIQEDSTPTSAQYDATENGKKGLSKLVNAPSDYVEIILVVIAGFFAIIYFIFKKTKVGHL